jgi:RHS repeat-associated protein
MTGWAARPGRPSPNRTTPTGCSNWTSNSASPPPVASVGVHVGVDVTGQPCSDPQDNSATCRTSLTPFAGHPVDVSYDGLTPIAWADTTSNRTLNTVYGPEGVDQQTDTRYGVSYFHLDLLGSPRALTNDSGATVAAGAYDDWGNPQPNPGQHHIGGLLAGAINLAAGLLGGLLGTTTRPPFASVNSATPLGYTSQVADPAQGLLHFHARSYQPRCGDWLQADPWGGLLTRPTSLNKYAYTENNPATYTDLLGYMRPTDDGGPGSGPAPGPVNNPCSDPGSIAYDYARCQGTHNPCVDAGSIAHDYGKCGGTGPRTKLYIHDGPPIDCNTNPDSCPTAAGDPQDPASNSQRYHHCSWYDVACQAQKHWRGALQAAAFGGCLLLTAGWCAVAAISAYAITDLTPGGTGPQGFALDAASVAAGFGVSKLVSPIIAKQVGGQLEGPTIFALNTGAHSAHAIDWVLAGVNFFANLISSLDIFAVMYALTHK